MQTHAPSFNFLCLMGLEKGLKIHSMKIVFIGDDFDFLQYLYISILYCQWEMSEKPLEYQALELNDLKVIY